MKATGGPLLSASFLLRDLKGRAVIDDPQHPIGWIKDMPNDAYHSGPGLSSTQIKVMGKSPLAYWDAYINPKREPREEKHCFAVGDGCHKLVLEPGTFEQTYAVGFDKSAHPNALDTVADLKKACSERGLMVSGSKPELADRLLNEGGVHPSQIMLALQQMHEATMAGRIPIAAKDYKDMLGLLQAVNNDPLAGPLLDGAETEQSYFWRCPAGVLRKCRTDAISADGEFILDLKTTDDVSQEGFGRTIANFGYHVSAAWYLDILQGLYGHDAPSGFAFIAVQKTRPYDVGVHYLTERQLHLGRLKYQKYLRTLLRCLETNIWPGATGGEFVEAKIPEWEMSKIEYLEAELL